MGPVVCLQLEIRAELSDEGMIVSAFLLKRVAVGPVGYRPAGESIHSLNSFRRIIGRGFRDDEVPGALDLDEPIGFHCHAEAHYGEQQFTMQLTVQGAPLIVSKTKVHQLSPILTSSRHSLDT